MRRGIWFALTSVLLVLLLLSVFIQAWVLPAEIDSIVAMFPETKPLAVPGFIWGVIAVACWQAVAVIAIRLAVLARDDRFHASAYGWLRAMVYFLLAFIVLAVAAFITLIVMEYATPGAMLGLFGGGLIAVIAVISLALYLAITPLTLKKPHAATPNS